MTKLPAMPFAAAQHYYTSHGYTGMDVPWIVAAEAYRATKPAEAIEFVTLGGYLVASGEQSFIQMLLEDRDVGRAHCITPCFRHEPYGELHLPYFTKLELIDAIDVSSDSLDRMIQIALRFFRSYLGAHVIATDSGYDIVSTASGIELGSYGIRSYRHLTWIYGTGLAEPRLGQAIAKQKG